MIGGDKESHFLVSRKPFGICIRIFENRSDAAGDFTVAASPCQRAVRGKRGLFFFLFLFFFFLFILFPFILRGEVASMTGCV